MKRCDFFTSLLLFTKNFAIIYLENKIERILKMKREPAFSWDPETGSALCLLFNKNDTYIGTAFCSPEDKDMMSEKTGCEIAYHRALIAALRARRDDLMS